MVSTKQTTRSYHSSQNYDNRQNLTRGATGDAYVFQAGEGGFKGVNGGRLQRLPVGKVRDEILAHFHCQILAGVSIKTRYAAEGPRLVLNTGL